MAVRALTSLRNGLSPTRFVREFQLPRRPGRFEELLTSRACRDKVLWPALSKWSARGPEGRETLGGLRRPETMELIVPVEISPQNVGYNDGSGRWDRIELPFRK